MKRKFLTIRDWFAWYPVYTINEGWVWLTTVERFTDNMKSYYYKKNV